MGRARLRAETGEGFPEKVTAFRTDMATHGRYKEPCPRCGTPIQRIRYAANETNYCPTCQTAGKLLADRVRCRDCFVKTGQGLWKNLVSGTHSLRSAAVSVRTPPECSLGTALGLRFSTPEACVPTDDHRNETITNEILAAR